MHKIKNVSKFYAVVQRADLPAKLLHEICSHYCKILFIKMLLGFVC